MLAVIALGGKQYNVTVGTKFKTEKIDLKEGKVFDIEDILLVSDEDGKDCKIGMPLLKEEKVQAKVLSHGKDEKVRVFKMKAKKRYSKVQGHRQNFTELEIVSIGGTTLKTETKTETKTEVKKEPKIEAKTATPKKSVTNTKKTDTLNVVKEDKETKESVKKTVRKPVAKKTTVKKTTEK